MFYYTIFKFCPTAGPPQMAAGITKTLVRIVNTCYILTMLNSFKRLLENYPESSIFI